MTDKVLIKFDIFGTGENVATFTFDEPTEERNLEKLGEALVIISSQILNTSKTLRELKLAGVDFTASEGARFKLSRKAGSDEYKLTPIKEEMVTTDET